MRRRSHFTLVELIAALLIFGVAALYLLERRSASIASAHYAAKSMEAMEVIDDVLQMYRLYPFSKDPLPLDEEKYEPFVVKVDVQEETINILPEEWRLEEDPFDDEKEKKRLILRVNVDVGFPKMDSDELHHIQVSTLIRHIELVDEEEGT